MDIHSTNYSQKKTAGLFFIKRQPGCLLDFGDKTRGFPTPSFGGSGFYNKCLSDVNNIRHSKGSQYEEVNITTANFNQPTIQPT